MDRAKTTPKDFFLWAGAMIPLYVSAFAFINLIFNYLNYAFPDQLSYYSGDPYQGGISYEMASLIVLFPLYLAISSLIIRGIELDSSRAQVWIRRWAIYLTLFVAGAAIAGDLITLIMYFFNGDVTLRFALKILVVLIVAGGGFLHFLADFKGYWQRERAKARILWWASGVLVVFTIIAGFFIIGTPWQARLYRFDDQKVMDLQNIQSQVVSYWQAKQALPKTLADLSNSISGFAVPNDPQSGQAYEYSVRGPLAFELCADFNAEMQKYSTSARTAPLPPASIGYPDKTTGQDNWQHAAGRVCFERTIDPQLYPPLPTQKIK